MTTRPSATTVARASTARAGGWPLARTGALVLLAAALAATLASPALSQTVTWEAMPGVRELPSDPDPITALDFLYGEGAQANDPAADTLVAFARDYGTFLYNPSGAAGAAGANGVWGPWHRFCSRASCTGIDAGLVTAAGTIVQSSLAGDGYTCRATNRGRRWTCGIENLTFYPLFESTLPALAGPDGTPALLAGTSDEGDTRRSQADGAPGTWLPGGRVPGYPQVLGEVPPSAALPNGRILIGVWNGALYSDDGGLSYRPSNAFGQALYIGRSFAFLPVAGHPYGGVAFAGLENVRLNPAPNAEVHRSDDGGATWTLAHRFTPEETGQSENHGSNLAQAMLYVTPDGALWSGTSLRNGSFPNRGGIMRSVDQGVTWQRADAGFAGRDGRGYRVNQLLLGRDGRLYAATERGVWRTTGPAVAGEAAPAAPASFGVSVRPNPAGGRVEVVLNVAEAGTARVVVVDALGRGVAVVLDGAVPAGERSVPVETAGWPAGVYVVRASVGSQTASARLVIVR